MKPTPNQVLDELMALQALSDRLPNARRNIALMYDALKNRFSVDDVYNQYDTEDPSMQYALDAAMWLAGDAITKPSEGWQ